MGDKGTGVWAAPGDAGAGYDPSFVAYVPPDGTEGTTGANTGYPYAPYAPNAGAGGYGAPNAAPGAYSTTPSYYPYGGTETKDSPVQQAYNVQPPPPAYTYPDTTENAGKGGDGFVNVDLDADQPNGGGNGTYEAYAPYGGGHGDPEDGDVEQGPDTNITYSGTRNQFLKKVYGIVTLQILLTTGIAMLCIFVDSLVDFFVKNPWVWIIFLVGGFITLFILQWKRQQYPTNMVLLLIFTLFMGWFVGAICATYKASGYGTSVAFAFVITLAIFVTITAYCWISKKDFSFLAGFIGAMFVALAIAFIIVYTASIFGSLNKWAWFGIAVAGSLLMTAVLLFDTSQIVNKYPVDEYIQGAISLYLDFINLFLCILSAFGTSG